MVKRKRATVLLRVGDGVLLGEVRSGLWLLPGGMLERNELPIAAAARELHEETGLEALSLEFVQLHESQSNSHHVYEVHAYTGQQRATSDVVKLHTWALSAIVQRHFPPKASPATAVILKSYGDRLLATGRLNLPDAQAAACESVSL